ncbi:MAG: FemAB family XrtA/PEP-CTERM system-associated protein [Planctomycetota bacterium]
MEPAQEQEIGQSVVQVDVSRSLPSWQPYLSSHPKAGLFHDPRWGQLMQEVYGAQPFYLTARREQETVGVLPLVLQRSLLFGRRLCSVPYFDAAGILADDAEAGDALLAAAGELRDEHRCRAVELRQLQSLSDDLPTRTDKVTMWLDLPEGRDAMWDQLKSKVRNKLRKAMKNDLEVQSGGGELTGEFYDVYSRNMRDLGSPPHSRRFFDRLAELFPDEIRLYVARADGRPHAAALGLVNGRTWHLPWSSSDRRFRNYSANRLMYWTMLADAADGGCAWFDFGRSTRDSGTHEFKREWGAEELQLHWQHLVAEGAAPPDLRPEKGAFRMLTSLWRRLPVPMARLLGPRIIAKLS